MPVYRMEPQRRHQRDDLVEILASELRAEGGGKSGAGKQAGSAPEIYIASTRETWSHGSGYGGGTASGAGSLSGGGSSSGGPLTVQVIWSRWAEVLETHRPDIIMDAFAKAGLEDELHRIAIAAGFTPQEAKILGIEPERNVEN